MCIFLVCPLPIEFHCWLEFLHWLCTSLVVFVHCTCKIYVIYVHAMGKTAQQTLEPVFQVCALRMEQCEQHGEIMAFLTRKLCDSLAARNSVEPGICVVYSSKLDAICLQHFDVTDFESDKGWQHGHATKSNRQKHCFAVSNYIKIYS